MEQPNTILKSGTKIRTNDTLESTAGMTINPIHLGARKAATEGSIAGCVPGHGGDVYWVQHDGDAVAAAYCFTEFELVEVAP